MKKLVSVLLTLAMMATMMSGVLASNVPGISDPTLPAGMQNTVGNVLGTIRWIGYAIAVIMIIYIGIKYMMSAANEKAELKKSLINYIIGAALVAGASTILTVIINWTDSNVQG